MVEDKHENLFLVQNSTKPSRKAILVLDKHLYLFPWEMTPTFRDFQVYRQPSTWHLAQQLSRRHDVDDQLLENKRPTDNNSVNYILNPSGDLRSTQEYFEGRLGDIDGWAGIVGRPPKEPEFISLISSTDLFLYLSLFSLVSR